MLLKGWTNVTGFSIAGSAGFAPGLDTLIYSLPLANLSFQEDVAANLDLSSLALSDEDSNQLSVTISVSTGTLAIASANKPAANTSANVVSASVTNNVVTVSGTVTEINAYLATPSNIRYTPASNANGTESATVTINVNDNNGSDNVTLQTVLIDVTAVNDAPVIANLNGDSVNFTQAGSAVLIDSGSSATVSDIDDTSLDGGSLSVSVTSGKDSAEDLLSFSSSSVTLGGTTSGSNVSVNNVVIGTLGNAISEGNDLVVNFNSNASLANVGLLLNAITYFNSDTTAPTSGSRSITVQVSDGDDSSEAAVATVSFTPLDSNTGFVFSNAATVITPAANSQSSAQTAVVIQTSDVGADGVATTITGLNFAVSGTLNPSNMGFVLRQVLNSTSATVATYQGQYANGRVSFTDTITIANGSTDNNLYLETYFNSSAGLTENSTISFSMTPVTDVTVLSTGSQIGTNTAQPTVTLTLAVTATQLRFNTEPAGSVSGIALTTQPVVHATDSFGNLDVDFQESVVLTEFSSGTLTGNTVTASAGIARFSGTTYFASRDNESFLLSADVAANGSVSLTAATSNTVLSQAIATRVAFTTEPSPVSVNSGTLTQFATVPVVSAQDALGILDEDYNAQVVLSETNGPGIANFNGTGDLDSSSNSVTLAFTSGVATFNGLEVTYNVDGQGNETFNLLATSGSLASATSQVITANDLPNLEGVPQEIMVTEDQTSELDLSGLVLSDTDVNTITLIFSVNSGILTGGSGDATSAGVTISGSGTATLTLSGLLNDLQAFLSSSSALTYLSALNDDTDASLTIVASDGQGDSGASTVSLSITPVNDSPVISGNGAATLLQGENYEFTPVSSDVDGDVLSFSIANQPDWLAFDNATGTLSGTADNTVFGTFEDIVISVSDGIVSQDLTPFTITVTADSGALIIRGNPDSSVNEDTAYSFIPDVVNVDGNELSFTIENQPLWSEFDSATGELSGTPGNNDVGDHVGIVISVADGVTTASLQAFSITVVNVNDAPTIEGTPQSTVSVGNTYTFQPIAADVDTQVLTYIISGLPEWATFDSTSGLLSGIPADDDIGSYADITISVFDGEFTASLEPFTIEVVSANNAPTISGIPALEVLQNNTYTFTPTANDEDGDVLSFSVENLPAWLTLNDQTGELSGVPENADVGIYQSIILTVSDGQSTASLPAFNIEVINVNDAPTITGTPTLVVVRQEPYSFTPEANDIDGDPLLFSIENRPAWLNFNEQTGELSGVPQNTDIGVYENIIVSVSDGELGASLPAFSLEVIVGVGVPGVDDQSVSVNEDSSVDIQLTGSDPEGDVLTYRIVESVTSGTLSLQGSIATYTPSENVSGITDQFTFVANDGVNDSLPGTITISVIAVNDAPVISGTPANSVKVQGSYSFTPTVSDIDSETLTFSIQNAPAWSQFSNETGSLSGQPGLGDAGTYGNITIAVSDGELSAQLASFSIEVLVNTPPIISGSAEVLAVVGEAYSFVPQVTDGDNDTLTFSIANQPSWTQFDVTTGALSGTPTAQDIATYNGILISVTDGVNTVSLSAFNIRVCEVCTNLPPTISGTPATTILAGENYLFTPTASDSNNDTLAFTVTNLPIWAAFDVTTGTLSGTPQEADVGIYAGIVISVSDSEDSVALSAFSIEVLSANDAPVISGTPASSVFQGERYQFIPVATDADNDTLVFSIINRPGWAAFNPQTGRLSGTPRAEDVGNYANITIRVTDKVNGAVSLPAFNIEVQERNTAPQISGQPRTSITIGVEYAFLPQASDTDGDSLTFTIENQPEWLVFDTQTGGLSGTPAEADLGTYSGIVITVSDGQEQTSLAAFSITVASDNVAPVAQDMNLSVDEDKSLNIQAAVTDDNQDDITLSVVNGPTNGTLEATNKGWTYRPAENFNGNDSFVYQASDGAAQSQQATVSIQVAAVNDKPVAENDSITLDQVESGVYLLDVLANDEDVDIATNGDVLTVQRASSNFGTVTIVDNQLQLDAGASFLGSVNLTYSIRDASAKNDTATVALTINGVDDLNAPVITIPADITVDASGLFTRVDLGTASAVDAEGNDLPVSLVDEQTNFSPGRHTVFWQAEDSFGTISTEAQQVNINPIISVVAADSVAEGSTTDVRFILNGEAPSYPYIVSYDVSGTAQGDGVDHSGVSGTVTFTAGQEQIVTLEILVDSQVEADETIIVSVAEGQNAGANGSATTIISENNIAPEVSLILNQNGLQRTTVAQDEGIVQIAAVVTDPNPQDSVALEWTSGTLSNQSIDDAVFEFDPGSVDTGLYTVSIYANDDGDPILDSTGSITFEIVDTFNVLSETEDSDGDLIPDAQEGYGDSDGDGVPDYLDAIDDCNVVAAQADNQSEFLVESDPDVCMRRGEISSQNDSNGLQVVLTATGERQSRINKAGERVTLIANNLPEDRGFENIGGIYDFVLYDLPQPGQSVRIVIPQSAPVPENAVYRKFDNNTERWTGFIRDDNNKLFTAVGERGNCPPPGAGSWTAGLNAGAWCVQLLIQDGGPNDEDGAVNASITDPGGVAIFVSDNTAPVALNDTIVMAWNTQTEISVLENDSDIDADSLSVVSASANSGTVEILDNGKLLYSARRGFSGKDTIDYIISDGNGGNANATVTITIRGNRAPGAVDDFAETDNKTAIEIDVLANDLDVDNDELTLINATAESGQVTISDNNTLLYTPEFSFSGLDSITYEVADPSGAKDTAVVSVFVDGNESPLANNDTVSTEFGTQVTIDVLSNDEDPDGDTLMVIEASALVGSVVVNADNSLTYTPSVGFSGSDTITYTVSDGVLTASATVTVDVREKPIEVVEVTSKSGGTINIFLLLNLMMLMLYRFREKQKWGKKYRI